MTQGGGDDLGADDGVGDEREAEETPGLLIQADVEEEPVEENQNVEEEPEEEQEVADQPQLPNLRGSRVAGVQNAADEGTQGTQAIPATQVPDLNTLPTLEEAHSTYIPTHKWPPKCVRPELARCLTSL